MMAPGEGALTPRPDQVRPSGEPVGIGAIIDDHLRWIRAWHKAVFFPFDRADEGDPVPVPPSFASWIADPARGLADQPVIDRLIAEHGRLTHLARVVVMRAGVGELPSLSDYDAVTGTFDDFLALLLRVERLLGAATANLDPLTGLRSRRGMAEDIGRELSRIDRGGLPFCLAICDIDRFKRVNDVHGHEAGDRVLAGVAGLLDRGTRSFDDVYRMGGEEFLICVKHAGIEEATAVLERLRAVLEVGRVALADGKSLAVTASFGVVAARTGTAVPALIAEADAALYRAKTAGRNRIEIAAPPFKPAQTAPA